MILNKDEEEDEGNQIYVLEEKKINAEQGEMRRGAAVKVQNQVMDDMYDEFDESFNKK